jgi:RNA polymerase sigma-70 factor, ECF subfamily
LTNREAEWAALMRAARAGDAAAYERCLRGMATALRPFVRRGLIRAGRSGDAAEDVVQEILLAVHLKRQTWDDTRPIGPWLSAIARYKLIDELRRRGMDKHVPIDDFSDLLAADETPIDVGRDVARSLDALPAGQRNVLRSVALDGTSIADTAVKLSMSEGAVRVALHRALATLTKRSETP